MFEQIKDFIANLWGKTSTLLLAIGVAILPVLQTIDPTMLESMPWLRTLVIVVGVGVAVLRVIAPPPPAVTIKKDDAVSVMSDQTVVITKAEGLPAKIVDQDPGKAA